MRSGKQGRGRVHRTGQTAGAGGNNKGRRGIAKRHLAANKFLDGGMPFVTIVGDGRVYTVEECALTIINAQE